MTTRRLDPSFAHAVAELLPDLRRRARYLESDAGAAEDLAQDTVERALRFASAFEQGSNLRAWLLRMQQNIFVSGKRRGSVQRRAYEALRVDPNAWTQGEAASESRAFSPAVSRALDGLPDRLGSVVRLVDVSELSYREAAEELRVPVGTIMSRLHRGRTRLREELGRVA
ncbi:MAG TPA: RNA polymerase sigma factor [Polyangiaceae bacterium]|nr:RNA polymerase sigma factor [Polyangiaceae bacterium]